MAKGNVRIVDAGGANAYPTWRWQVAASATLIYPGEPVKLTSAGDPSVVKLADGEPVIGTTVAVIGIAASTSTNTASVAGVVDVYIPIPGMIYACKPKVANAANTVSEINALCGDTLVFDLTSTTFSIDAAAGTGATGGLMIVGGNPDNDELYFTIRPSATQGPIA